MLKSCRADEPEHGDGDGDGDGGSICSGFYIGCTGVPQALGYWAAGLHTQKRPQSPGMRFRTSCPKKTTPAPAQSRGSAHVSPTRVHLCPPRWRHPSIPPPPRPHVRRGTDSGRTRSSSCAACEGGGASKAPPVRGMRGGAAGEGKPRESSQARAFVTEIISFFPKEPQRIGWPLLSAALRGITLPTPTPP